MKRPTIIRIATLLLLGLSGASASSQAQESSLGERVTSANDAYRAAAGSLGVDDAAISIAAFAGTISSSRPDAAWEAVRQRTSFDPYEGSLRGARGALFSAGGNALDTSLLLGAVYDELGVDWRLARCTLDDASSVALVRSATGDGRYLGPLVPADADVSDAARDIRHRNMARDHFFVEVETRDGWIAYDPTWPLAEPGVAPCVATATFEDGVPPAESVHRATIGVHYATRGTDGGVAVAWSGAISDVAWRNLTLELDRNDVDDRVVPRLTVLGETVDGASIPLEGTERIWVEFYFSLGGIEDRVVRDLYRADSQTDRLHLDQQIYSLVLLPGFVGPDYFHAVVAALQPDVARALATMVDAAEDSAAGMHVPPALATAMDDSLGLLMGLTALSFANVSDEAALELASTLGVRPWYGAPRVLISGAFRHGSSLSFELDVRSNDIDTAVFEGVPPAAAYAFNATRGRADTALAGDVLARCTGQEARTVVDIFAAARASGAALRTVHLGNVDRVAAAAYSDEARFRLAESVSNAGLVALVPSQAIDFDGIDLLGWWRIAPGTGAIMGVTEHDVAATIGPVGAPSAAPGRGADAAAATADAIASFARGLGTSSAGYDAICAARCDLLSLSARLCSGDRPAEAFADCLRGRASGGNADLLQLTTSCTAVVEPMACGAELTDAVIGRYIELRTATPPFSGPWPSITSMASQPCVCP